MWHLNENELQGKATPAFALHFPERESRQDTKTNTGIGEDIPSVSASTFLVDVDFVCEADLEDAKMYSRRLWHLFHHDTGANLFKGSP